MKKGTDIAIDLLGKGIDEADCAHILGANVADIQAIALQYKDKIAEMLVVKEEVHATLDAKMDAIENTLVDKIKNAIQFESDPMKLVKTFQIMNGAKRRSQGEGQPGTNISITDNRVVALNLPNSTVNPQFKTNANNEVVEVDGKHLVSATSKQVLEMAEEDSRLKVQENVNDMFTLIEQNSAQEG